MKGQLELRLQELELQRQQTAAELGASPRDWIKYWLYMNQNPAAGGSNFTPWKPTPYILAGAQSAERKWAGQINPQTGAPVDLRAEYTDLLNRADTLQAQRENMLTGKSGINWVEQLSNLSPYEQTVYNVTADAETELRKTASDINDWLIVQNYNMPGSKYGSLAAEYARYGEPNNYQYIQQLPSVPSWLPQFAPGVGKLTPAGTELTKVPIKVPSGQLWSRTPWSVQQGLAGYADWAMGAPGVMSYEDLMAQQAMMQPVTPAGVTNPYYRPRRQWA